MRENHPDSLAARGVPAEFIARANEKVARINAAWDRIKRERPRPECRDRYLEVAARSGLFSPSVLRALADPAGHDLRKKFGKKSSWASPRHFLDSAVALGMSHFRTCCISSVG